MGGQGAGSVGRSLRMPPDLAAAIDSCARGRGPLRAQCLLSDGDFSGAVTAGGSAAARVEVISRGLHGRFAHCAYSVTGKGASGTLRSLQQGGRVLLLSGEGGKFFDAALRIAKGLQPGVIAPFTESTRIKSILEGLEEGAGVPLRCKKSVRKRTVGAMPRTVVEWGGGGAGKSRGYGTVGDAFADAEEKGMVIDSLRAFSDGDGGLDVTVSRRGLVTVHRGGIKGVYDSILRPILDHGMDRRARFSGRSRRDRPDREPRPLLVRYKEKVFAGDGDAKRFCELIAGYPRCNYVVVHAGGSSLHISIVDRMDNSTISLRSVNGDALAIIPQIKTTEASLLRLTGFLASAFCEGEIAEYEWRR